MSGRPSGRSDWLAGAHLRRQAAVVELGQRALAGDDVPALMRETCGSVASALGVDLAGVLELTPGGESLLLRAGVGWRIGCAGRAVVEAPARSQAAHALSSSRPLVVEDLRTERRFVPASLLAEHGAISGVSVPIRCGRRPFGLLVAHATRKRAFGEDEVRFLQAVANVLATAVARARDEEIRERLIQRAISAQDDEKRRIARELHDETGQALTYLLAGLRALEGGGAVEHGEVSLKSLREIAARCLEGVRRLARGLHPSLLDDLGLEPALQRHAADQARLCGMRVRLDAFGLGQDRLPLPIETAVYRIAQEALSNAARHSGASQVLISLRRDERCVEVAVEDDGRGFDVEAALRDASASGRLGLHGIRERAALLGGSVRIESRPGRGAAVRARIPAPPASPVR